MAELQRYSESRRMRSLKERSEEEARLDRDQALQVFSLPWGELSMAIAGVSAQAIHSASVNRQADFSIGIPGERIKVNVGKLKGNVLVWPTSTEIPPTMAEQQAEIAAMIQAAATTPFYAAILADPRNLEMLRRLPSMAGLKIPGLDDVIAQVEDNQKLLTGEPLPNPQLEQAKEQLMMLMQQASANPYGKENNSLRRRKHWNSKFNLCRR